MSDADVATATGPVAALTPSVETAVLCLHLQGLSTMLWTDLDENDGRAWPDHFTEDGTFDFNSRLTSGRTALREHFEVRAARGMRVTAHLLSNLRTEITAPREAVVRAFVCTFGGDGSPPQPVSLPSLIGVVEDHFEQDDDGRWLVKLRRFRPKFYNTADRVGRLVVNG